MKHVFRRVDSFDALDDAPRKSGWGTHAQKACSPWLAGCVDWFISFIRRDAIDALG